MGGVRVGARVPEDARGVESLVARRERAGDLELSTPRLTLPHPEVSSRRFVLAPLLELDPELALPDGRRISDFLAALGPGQRAERSDRPFRVSDSSQNFE